VLAVAMLPFFFAERDTDHAIRTWRADLAGAYTDLNDAADLNPWSSRALEAKAEIALANGNTALALSAIDEGIKRTPNDPLLFYQRARAQKTVDPAGARASIARARQLSPQDPEISSLANKLGVGH
jgi:Flp pilus assembly protein TadD